MACNGSSLFTAMVNGPALPPVRVRTNPFSAAAAAGLALALSAHSQLRCDLQVKSTPGLGAEVACLDLEALKIGGQAVQTSNNTTRISREGFSICGSAFTVKTAAEADIVFIYDNSGSMWADYAKINTATNDTNYFHNQGCGANPVPTTGTFVYNTVTGPRTVAIVDSTRNCAIGSLAGDPYNARASVLTTAIDFLAATSPNSTAGAVGFALTIGHAQPPLPMSGTGPATLKASIVMDSIPSTNYAPPLREAYKWLDDTTLTNTQKKAIVFISDGNANDDGSFANLIRQNIPIYGIFLGDSSAVDLNATGAQENDLVRISRVSGGSFALVPPGNTARLNEVMRRIIEAITQTNVPQLIEVTNASTKPVPMTSRSTSITQDQATGTMHVVLDSIIALVQGANDLTVRITMSAADIREYKVKVQADGPEAGSSTTTLECHRMPALVMLNQSGAVDSGYPSGPTPYDVRLVRTTSDLEQVVVKAVTSDSSRPGWGDDESITLPQTSRTADSTVNRRENYPFNGGVDAPAKGNNILEATPDGRVTLTWSHPRDAREFAVFVLGGRPVPTTPGFIEMVRAKDVPKGVDLTVPITNPVVIRGGVTLVQNGTEVNLTHKGILTNPHNLDDRVLNPNQTPTFIFKTASAFAYKVSVYDHLGQFLNSAEGAVDSLKWEQMRGTSDSLAVALSILPVSNKGQQFGSGVYIMRATLTTRASLRQDPNRPARVTPIAKVMVNRFGYLR